jgi:hypothetical protein
MYGVGRHLLRSETMRILMILLLLWGIKELTRQAKKFFKEN